MKRKSVKLLLMSCTGVVLNFALVLGAAPVTPVTEKVDSQIVEAVKGNFAETESVAAQNLLIPCYALGKSENEIAKYIDFSQAESSADNKGTVYTFKECDISFLKDSSKATETWHFDENGKLNNIDISFDYASDVTNFETLDTLESVFGKYTETTNAEYGMNHCFWNQLPNIEVMQMYNFEGSDKEKDDGVISLNVVLSKKAEDTSKATENVSEEVKNKEPEQTPEPTKALVEFKDVTTIRIVQQTLNELGYNCGNPDGVAGQNTTQAITSYQTEKGITVNGLVTDELLESLGIVEKVQKAVAAEGAKNEYGSNYTYDQLARNPDTYIGSKIKINGKVLQTGEDGDLCYARIAMNSNYDTVVFVIYEKDLLGYKLLDDDIVTVYGTSLGEYSYEAVSGATITIPCLNGDIIEM